MTSEEEQEHLNYIDKLCETQGVAAVTVKDGHLLYFKTSYLKALIEQNNEKEKLVIFLKRAMEPSNLN